MPKEFYHANQLDNTSIVMELPRKIKVHDAIKQISLGAIRCSKWSLGVIAITIISAIALSVFAYNYYNSQSTRIYSIAQDEIRSNARIASHDLSNSLSNKFSSISSNLLVLTQSPAIRAKETVRMESLLTSAQTTSKDLTDFYNWADKDGKIVATSIEDNNPQEPKFLGADISFRPWYQSPKQTLQSYAAPTTSSLDGLPRLFVSQPVIALDMPSGTKSFDGIVYAGIGFDKIGKYLETQLSPELAGSLTLIDKGGNIVYSKDQSILGENVLGDEFQNGHLTSVILSN